ncbi:hypothetical protein FRB96_000743 [Tulasnella sp. 330]|nr:hypothetical protein FRB96_000743 [Tulasnella sp. 330]
MASKSIGICPDCVKGRRLPGDPTGEVVQVDHLSTYFRSASASSETAKPTEKKAIVLLYDIFGFQLDNIKIVADELSKNLGIDVFAPDYFLGKPPMTFEEFGPHLLSSRPGQVRTWSETFSFVWTLIKNSPSLLSLVTSLRPAVINPRIEEFLKGLRAQGYTRIGVVGYCIGGIAAFHIATTDLATSCVIAHPGPVATEAAKGFKVPSSWVMAEEDHYFPPTKRNEVEAILRAKEPGLTCEFVDHPGTCHGFAIRPDVTLPDQKAAFENSLDQISAWFGKTL